MSHISNIYGVECGCDGDFIGELSYMIVRYGRYGYTIHHIFTTCLINNILRLERSSITDLVIGNDCILITFNVDSRDVTIEACFTEGIVKDGIDKYGIVMRFILHSGDYTRQIFIGLKLPLELIGLEEVDEPKFTFDHYVTSRVLWNLLNSLARKLIYSAVMSREVTCTDLMWLIHRKTMRLLEEKLYERSSINPIFDYPTLRRICRTLRQVVPMDPVLELLFQTCERILKLVRGFEYVNVLDIVNGRIMLNLKRLFKKLKIYRRYLGLNYRDKIRFMNMLRQEILNMNIDDPWITYLKTIFRNIEINRETITYRYRKYVKIGEELIEKTEKAEAMLEDLEPID